MKINTGLEQSRGKNVKRKKKAGKQESVMNIEVYSPANQIQPFHKGWNLGHGCYILPICLSHLWYSIIHHCGGCSLHWAGQLLDACLSVSLLPFPSHTQSGTYKLCLSLPVALRHGVDGSIVTVLGSERSDRGREEDGDGGAKEWYEREDRWIKGRKNKNSGSGINITASLADIIDCIRDSFVNH